MFKAKRPGFIVVHDEKLSFMSPDKQSGWQCIDSFPVSSFLDSDVSIDILHKKYRDYDFSLMIVPDFWFGNRTFEFHSKNKTAIESFIARKLKLEFPESPEIQNFFSYNIIKNKGKQELVSLILHEPKAALLCKSLARHSIRPVRITSPALLWNKKLKKTVDSFEESGVVLIYLLRDECFLLFYYLGNFLFSRTIPLPESGKDNAVRFKSLSFEINQSAYHFSQRTKTQLNKIFLISRADDNIDQLKTSLGRDINFLDEKSAGYIPKDELTDRLGLSADFTPDELFPFENVPGVSDRLLVKKIEINKIQISGIIIGIILLLILGMEGLFLHDIKHREAYISQTREEDPKQLIEQYNKSLDAMLLATQRKKPLSVIGRLAESLPANIMTESIEAELEQSHSLSFKGTIKAEDINDFSFSLRSLIDNLNNNFRLSNPINIDDVEIEMAGKPSENGRQNYNISFYLDLI
ncbi:MAG: hypothetical protein JXL81_06275 [Deltaproteobacteria bacterium]|nr:hypothetical protein [Deltaproteobacteria bacterium]